MSGKYHRKIINFSVKRHMQMRLFVKVLGVALVGIGLMAVIFYFYSNREINESYRQFHVHAKNFLDYLLPAVLFSVIGALLFAVCITLFFPLRIAGPLYRIEREMKEKVADGDLTVRFKLRKGDEMDDLAHALNLSLEKLGNRIKMIKTPVEQLEAKAVEQDSEIRELVKEIHERLSRLKV